MDSVVYNDSWRLNAHSHPLKRPVVTFCRVYRTFTCSCTCPWWRSNNLLHTSFVSPFSYNHHIHPPPPCRWGLNSSAHCFCLLVIKHASLLTPSALSHFASQPSGSSSEWRRPLQQLAHYYCSDTKAAPARSFGFVWVVCIIEGVCALCVSVCLKLTFERSLFCLSFFLFR